MARELDKDAILNHLLEAASAKWSRSAVEETRPAFELAAEAIWKVEEFELDSEEEPAHPATITHRGIREREE
jgi:hypothetical protein